MGTGAQALEHFLPETNIQETSASLSMAPIPSRGHADFKGGWEYSPPGALEGRRTEISVSSTNDYYTPAEVLESVSSALGKLASS